MSQENAVPELTRLAQVKSADVILSSILINPSVLKVVAQPSGFNWRVEISVQELDPPMEYVPYFVVEHKTGPGWPKDGGIGPVVEPVTLFKPILHAGVKGIEVIGQGFRKKFDVKAPMHVAA